MSSAVGRQLITYTPRKKNRAYIVLDFFVTVLCLSVSAFCLYLFYLSLTQTLTSDSDPIGTVTIKYNSVVQRRMGDRVLWDRVFNESPLYNGDLIRVSEYSGALLHFEDNQVDLDENSLIRVTLNELGQHQVDLYSGNLNLIAGENSENLIVLAGGKTIKAETGTVLNTIADEDGMLLKVSEGRAFIIDENGEIREVPAGTVLSFDADGNERFVPQIVAVSPRQNTRFLKNGPDPVTINFTWSAINVDGNIRMEVSADRSFNNIEFSQIARESAQAALGAGTWNWRLVYRGEVLHNSRLAVIETAPPVLISPQDRSIIRYRSGQPEVRFRWLEVEDAAYYFIDVSASPDFYNLRLSEQIFATSFSNFDLGPGMWYWRVRSVLPQNYDGAGNAANSNSTSKTSGFRIELSDEDAIIDPPPEEIATAPAATAPAAAPAVQAAPAAVEEQPQPAPQPTPPPSPPPPLAAPGNMRPVRGTTIDSARFRALRSLDFSWSGVSGANAYILTIYQDTANGRRQVIRTNPVRGTSWSLRDLSLLDRGTFVWQVEAVVTHSAGTIQRRGTPGTSSFIIDVPIPEVELHDVRNLYE